MLWVTKMTVGRRCIQSGCRSLRIVSRVIASSLPSGSSSSSVSGSCTMRLAEGGALLHAARQLVRIAVREIRRGGPSAMRPSIRSAWRRVEAAQLELQFDVAADRAPRHQRIVLEHDADVGLRRRRPARRRRGSSPRLARAARRSSASASTCRSPTGRAARRIRPARSSRSAGPKAWTSAAPVAEDLRDAELISMTAGHRRSSRREMAQAVPAPPRRLALSSDRKSLV